MTENIQQHMNKDKSLPKAFLNAFNGLRYFFLHERNGKIQLGISVIVIALATYFQITTMEWVSILLCTGAVLGLEMMNSAVEKLCDLVHTDYHPVIKIIKDVAAASVLWASIISSVIGCIIFLPKLWVLLF